jgi:hypothetical protein
MTAILVSSILAVNFAAQGPGPTGAPYVPSQTAVAILPFVNASIEKWNLLKTREIKRGFDTAVSGFKKRGFQIIADADIQAAIHGLKVDLFDEENQNRARLFAIGEKLKANLIFFAVVDDTNQIHEDNGALESTEPGVADGAGIAEVGPDGDTVVKAWLLDVGSKKIWLSAKKFESRSRSNMFDFWGKGSDRQVAATGDAVRASLKEFVVPYPDPTLPKPDAAKPHRDEE